MQQPPLTPDVDAYRRLNRNVALALVIAAAWQIGAHLLAVQIGHPLHQCPSRAWLGIPCPLCGLTRGTVALLRGDLSRALAWHPLTLVAVTGACLEVLYRAIGASRKVAPHLLRWQRTDLLLHLALGLLFILYAVAFHIWRATRL